MKKYKGRINYYIFIFLFASICGWCGELVWRSIYFKRLVNPGALIGPFCPIYGCAVVILFFILQKKRRFMQNALIMFFVCGIVEYLTAYISESFFNSRLWNYSKHPLNYQGRICLDMTIMFTCAALACYYFLKPKIDLFIENHPKFIKYFNIIVGIIFICNIIIQNLW